jgi:hypothetical protein
VSSISSTPVDISPPLSAISTPDLAATPKDISSPPSVTSVPQTSPNLFHRQPSVDLGSAATNAAQEARAAVGAWGAGIGSFLSTRASRFSIPKVGTGLTGSARSSLAPSPVDPLQTKVQAQTDATLLPLPPPPKFEEAAVPPAPPPVVTSPPLSRVKAAVAVVEAHLPETKTSRGHHGNELPVKDLDNVHTDPSPPPSSGSAAEAEKEHHEEPTASGVAL